MSKLFWQRLGMLLVVLALLGGGYFGWMMMPGGALTGTATAVPADWMGVEIPKVVQLETNPAQPYSVKIWVVPIGANLYVHAGDNHTQWVKHLENDSAVRMLMRERLYRLRAERVSDAQEFAVFCDAYERRYGRRPRNENVNEAYLFRLTANGEVSGEKAHALGLDQKARTGHFLGRADEGQFQGSPPPGEAES